MIGYLTEISSKSSFKYADYAENAGMLPIDVKASLCLSAR